MTYFCAALPTLRGASQWCVEKFMSKRERERHVVSAWKNLARGTERPRWAGMPDGLLVYAP